MSYIYNLSDTWNSAPTTYTAIKMSVTDTASAANSLLMDLQVGGSSKVSISKLGSIATTGSVSSYIGTASFWVASNAGWIQFGASPDLILARDAANTLAQRNGTNAQAFRVYNTYTDASNYERGVFDWSATANILTIGTAKAGTGATRAIDVIVGGAQKLQIGAASASWAVGLTFATDNTYDIGASGANRPRIVYAGAGFEAASGGTIGFSDGWFSRDAANTIAMRNGTSAQTFRIYNTYTDASNYERLAFSVFASEFLIQTQSAGTGTARSLFFGSNGTRSWVINTSNHFLAVTDNTYDIGAPGGSRPRNLYLGGSATLSSGIQIASNAGYNWASGTNIKQQSDGVITLFNNGDTSFGRLQFGGTTSSFPALKRSGSSFQVRLADDSGYAMFDAGEVRIQDDVILARDAANTLAQRNGTNAQAFRLYKTYTDTSNYSRMIVGATAGGNFSVLTSSAGTGSGGILYIGNAEQQPVTFQTNNTDRWSISGSGGHFLAAADNTFDIGASGANRPRNIYAAGQTDIAGLSGSITATAVPAGGTQALRMTTTSALGVYVGSGAPTVSAAKGSLYLRTDGTTTNDRMYVNTNGSTTWTAVTTVA